jgi:hypothetical protein
VIIADKCFPTKEYDISGDGKVGLAEVIRFLQILCGKIF